MAKNRNALSAGIFMVLSVAAIIAIVIGIYGSARFSKHFTPRLVSFKLSDNLGGLQEGDDVRLGGQWIGSVDSVQFKGRGPAPQNNPPEDSVLVTIELPDDLVMYTNANIEVETKITGLTCLNITDLGSGAVQA